MLSWIFLVMLVYSSYGKINTQRTQCCEKIHGYVCCSGWLLVNRMKIAFLLSKCWKILLKDLQPDICDSVTRCVLTLSWMKYFLSCPPYVLHTQRTLNWFLPLTLVRPNQYEAEKKQVSWLWLKAYDVVLSRLCGKYTSNLHICCRTKVCWSNPQYKHSLLCLLSEFLWHKPQGTNTT